MELATKELEDTGCEGGLTAARLEKPIISLSGMDDILSGTAGTLHAEVWAATCAVSVSVKKTFKRFSVARTSAQRQAITSSRLPMM